MRAGIIKSTYADTPSNGCRETHPPGVSVQSAWLFRRAGEKLLWQRYQGKVSYGVKAPEWRRRGRGAGGGSGGHPKYAPSEK